jgi:phosphoglycolate phosphatase
MKVREVVFDLDGTLLDSVAGIEWSLEQALDACGAPPPDGGLAALLGPPIRQIIGKATGISDPEMLDRVERAFRVSYDHRGWRMTTYFEGVPDRMRLLRERGFRLWVATNKPAAVSARILAELAIGGYFEEVVCRDSRTPAYSSKGELLADLLRRRRLEAERCVMIGDTEEDALAAKQAGVECVLVGRPPDLAAVETVLN